MNKISIITINYNNKIGLEKTLSSVLDQSFTDFEFIIVDGDSADGSKDLLASNKSKFTHCISEPDHGIYNAMNKGIRLAKGDYLLFLNSGDILHNNDVIKNVNELIRGDYDIYYGDVIHLTKEVIREEKFPDHLSFSFFYVHNLCHQASFIKRKLFYELFFYNEEFKIISDWEFFVYAICKMNVSYKHLNMFISYYDTTGISSNLENHALVLSERSISITKHFPTFIKDYNNNVADLGRKRVKQFFYIKSHPVSWRVLKTFMSVISIFLTKKHENT
jgi:glycosyltransferase involved in cell wall biosynthesis